MIDKDVQQFCAPELPIASQDDPSAIVVFALDVAKPASINKPPGEGARHSLDIGGQGYARSDRKGLQPGPGENRIRLSPAVLVTAEGNVHRGVVQEPAKQRPEISQGSRPQQLHVLLE